ncbi:Yip1-like protein [Aliiruegeria haliotis]|uniref:Yip1-like protein n=1 Tax=Aliiruegeria haliotis TaxID=1280846 RepID=A0A2T0RZM3_9RHOB|nr:YIP1 family protein [Aliiruegeria haliotis]PRY26572.1 Yip1-like protein [Aliiruegeria haliotis]
MTQFSFPIKDLVRESFKDPKGAARRIIGYQIAPGVLWEVLALVVILSVIVGQGPAFLTAAYDDTSGMMLPGFFFSPVLLTVVMGILLVLVVLAVHGVGRLAGGQGTLPGALAIVAWLQFLLVCLQLVQNVTLFVMPFMASLIGLASIGLFFYLLTQFVCALHGFRNAGVVFVGILFTMMGLIVLMSIVLAVLGVGLEGGPTGV